MRYTLDELSKLDPVAIAAQCSRKHIQSVLEALITTAKAGLQAVAVEREACAKICDEQHDRARTSPGAARTMFCAAAIRARGEN